MLYNLLYLDGTEFERKNLSFQSHILSALQFDLNFGQEAVFDANVDQSSTGCTACGILGGHMPTKIIDAHFHRLTFHRTFEDLKTLY
jgi:hypothetical protein